MVRSGDEPTTARSPLGLRLVLAVFGLLSGLAVLAAGLVADVAVLTVGGAFLAAVAAADVVVVRRRMRQGPHFQPGPDVPPYQVPVSPDDRRPHRARVPTTTRSRERSYLVIMGICLTLVLVSWVWLRTVNTTAAVLVGAVAAVLPPVAAIVANAGWEPPSEGPEPESDAGPDGAGREGDGPPDEDGRGRPSGGAGT